MLGAYQLNPSQGGGGAIDTTNLTDLLNPDQGVLDVKQLGDTLLYTVPAGKDLLLKELYFKTVTAQNIQQNASFNLGFTAPDYNDITDFSFFTVSDVVDAVRKGGIFPNGSIRIPGGQSLYIRIIGAEGGDALTVIPWVEGILIDQ